MVNEDKMSPCTRRFQYLLIARYVALRGASLHGIRFSLRHVVSPLRFLRSSFANTYFLQCLMIDKGRVVALICALFALTFLGTDSEIDASVAMCV